MADDHIGIFLTTEPRSFGMGPTRDMPYRLEAACPACQKRTVLYERSDFESHADVTYDGSKGLASLAYKGGEPFALACCGLKVKIVGGELVKVEPDAPATPEPAPAPELNPTVSAPVVPTH